MNKITTTLTVTNRVDQILAQRGLISLTQVRWVSLKNALVEPSITTLCLPAKIISHLGLSLLKEVDITTATGFRKIRVFEGAKIHLGDREGSFECFELPGATDALIGKIPLLALGIELDLQNNKLIFLSELSYLRI